MFKNIKFMTVIKLYHKDNEKTESREIHFQDIQLTKDSYLGLTVLFNLVASMWLLKLN